MKKRGYFVPQFLPVAQPMKINAGSMPTDESKTVNMCVETTA